MTELRFTVYGKPKPGGSKRSFRHPQTGQIIVTEDSDNKNWRSQVAQAGALRMSYDGVRDLLTGPLHVTFTFVRPRPASHYGSGRNAGTVKQSAPAFPTTRPDVLKLARAAEDALTGQVWRDDAQIVDEHLVKVWGQPERLEVLVKEMTA